MGFAMMKLGSLMPIPFGTQRLFTARNELNHTTLRIIPFRPIWWPEVDPITGHPVISASMT
jgi:hypothetical protein